MKKYLFACLILSVNSSLFSATYTLNMVFDDSARNFIVHLPPGFSTSQHLPLVINMHGYGSDAAQEEFYSRMSETSDSNHFVVVYPNGLSKRWNSGFVPPYNGGVDDVGFISKIIDTVFTLYNIDLTRVYACGMSNGGYQSYRLACDLENRIAAIASVTGTTSDLTALNCVLSRKIPILEIHGTADPLVPYGGSAGSYSVEDNINFWLGKNQCSMVNDTFHYPDIDIHDSSTVERIHYASCGSGTEVLFYKITGGGHTWPNAYIDFIYGPTNRDFDASQEIWNFFKRFTLNGSVGTGDIASDEIELKVFPNPFEENLEVYLPGLHAVGFGISANKNFTAAVFDISGRKIFEQKIFSALTEYNLSAFGSGIYYLRIDGDNFSQTKLIVKE